MVLLKMASMCFLLEVAAVEQSARRVVHRVLSVIDATLTKASCSADRSKSILATTTNKFRTADCVSRGLMSSTVATRCHSQVCTTAHTVILN